MPHKPRIVSTCYKNHLNSFHNKIKAPTSKSFCMLVVGWRSKSSRDEMLMLMMMTDSEEDFFFAIEHSMKVEYLINQKNTDDDYERGDGEFRSTENISCRFHE